MNEMNEILKRLIYDIFMFSLPNAGTIIDCFASEKELAQCFLAILNRSDEYKKWANLSNSENGRTLIDHSLEYSNSSEDMKRKRQYSSDHTQVFVLLLSESKNYDFLFPSELVLIID